MAAEPSEPTGLVRIEGAMWFGHTQPDLLEGIRAQLIDEDRTPRRRPATPAEVDPAVVASAPSYVPSPPLWG